jgi:arylsulfatase A
MTRCSWLLLLIAIAFGQTLAAEPGRPNVILIMADDFGYECVTANGGESYKTPNLDRLAATGMRFENCFVQPLCTPTRVQLMTGIYNVRNYVQFGLLDPKATTFAHLLKKSGYATGITGKWQLGREKELPQHFGFDESFLWQHTRRPPRYANPGLELNGVEKDYNQGEYGPDLINDFAMDFVTRHKEHPFFLYYPMMLTHGPFQPTPDSPEWDAKTQGETARQNTKHFADMTAYMDKLVGRLMGKLDDLKIRDNTLVLFVGDNGTGRGLTSQYRGAPYDGGKGQTNARGMHVPLIANWPGKIAAGKVNADLIDSTDFLPTVCGATGVAIPESLKIDGRSFLPQALGEKGEPRSWIYCWYAPDGGSTADVEFAISKTHKLYSNGELHRISGDPYQEQIVAKSDYAPADAEAARTLQAALDQYAKARPPELAASDPPAKNAAKKAGRAERAKRKAKQE